MDNLASLPKEVLDKLQALADKLGVSIQFVYEQLVKDNTRLGLMGMIVSVVVIVVCAVVAYIALKSLLKILNYIKACEDWSKDTQTALTVCSIVAIIFLLTGMFATACINGSNAVDAAKRFAAPNKYSIEDIRDLIHGESLVYDQCGNTK